MPARLITVQFPGPRSVDDLTTERSFDSQATWYINQLGLFFDLLPMGVCTSRPWKMSGRLVQKLNDGFVPQSSKELHITCMLLTWKLK